MKHFVELPSEILTTIMIVLASSYGGAGDIARLSSTSKKFMELADEPPVLKAINFQSLTPTEDYAPHRHLNGLLCKCAKAGNLAAEVMLGRALLFNDYWFWNILTDNDQLFIARDGPGSGVIPHERLVRSFIVHANCEEMAPMRLPLFGYMISFLGHNVARECGILVAVTNLCYYEVLRLNVRNLSDIPEYSGSIVSELTDAMARLTPPSGAIHHRERLLALFDQLFPTSPV